MDSPQPGISSWDFPILYISMAQSKSFFGLRRGSTKTLTFSVYNGKQVTKDRVADVKNPRSSSQMKQRAIMATALHAYSAMKEICDHSFEGLTYGQKSMNYFVSENARMIRSTTPNVNLSLFKGNSVSNAYIISKGSLPPIANISTDSNVFILANEFSENFTFGEFMAGLGATMIGDMITFVNLVDNPGGNASLYWIRLKLTEQNKSKSFTRSEDPQILQSLVEGEDFETSIDNFTADDFKIQYSSERNLFTVTTGSDTSQSLGAIVSRKTDTGWLRSSSTMVNLKDTFNYTEALATYPETNEKILNGGNV